MKQIKFKSLFLFSTLSIFLASCVNEPKRLDAELDTATVSTSDTTTQSSRDKIARIQKIFYTLPSPLELTYLFKKEGVDYHKEALHQINRRSDYNLTVKKALNLGVYGADLSYAGLFGQHQDAIEYYTTTQLMAEELGIGQTFQKEFISRLERNANNKDTLLQVVSEFFLDNDSYLKNQNQQDVSTYILTGGWIEGLYLGTEMADKNANSSGIREIIAGQRFSLDNLIILLESLNNKDGSEEILNSIKEIKKHFNSVEPSNTDTKTTATNENGVLKISSNAEAYTLPDSSFTAIKEEVAAIRSNIIE